MKTAAEKGLTGHLLTELRKARGFSNGPKAAAHVVELTGVTGLSDSVWKDYEAGNRPISDKHRKAIEAILGPIGDTTVPAAPAASPDIAQLVAAIERQQAQIVALQGMVQSLVHAIETDRQGPPWLDDAVPAAARYILSGLQPGKASER